MRGAFLLATLACGSALAQQPPAPPKPTGVVGVPGGRFAFGQISDFRRDQYMLDTQTGRMWQIVCYPVVKDKPIDGDNCFKVLEPVLYAPMGGVTANRPLGVTPQ